MVVEIGLVKIVLEIQSQGCSYIHMVVRGAFM